MYRTNQKKLLIILCVLSAILGFALTAWSADNGQAGGPPGIIISWDGEGYITDIDNERLVIGDTAFQLETRLQYLDSDNTSTTPARFVKGAWVAYRLNDNGKVTALIIPNREN